MAGSSEIKAGGAYVSLGVKQSAFEKGLKDAEKRLYAFGKTVATIGAGMMGGGLSLLAPLGFFIEKFVDTGVELQRVHEQLGMTVEDLSALKNMAAESGVGLEELATDFFKFQQGLGSGKSADILKRIGVSAADLNGKSTADQLVLIADAFSRIHDDGLRAIAARELFGKGSRTLVPILNQGGSAMQSRLATGGTFSSEDAKRAEEFHLALLKVKQTVSSVAIALGGELVGALAQYTEPVIRNVTLLANWIKEHRSVVVTVGAVAAGLVAGGAALIGFGAAIAGAGTAIGAMLPIVAALKAGIVFLISPPGLVLAAVVALVGGLGYLASRTDTVRGWLQQLGESFGLLRGRVSEAWGGIVEAVRAGDLSSAVRIGWLEIQREFTIGLKYIRLWWGQGIDELMSLWGDFVVWYGSKWFDSTAMVAKFLANSAGIVLDAWDTTTSFVTAAWEAIGGNTFEKIGTVGIGVAGRIGKTWVEQAEMIRGVWERVLSTQIALANKLLQLVGRSTQSTAEAIQEARDAAGEAMGKTEESRGDKVVKDLKDKIERLKEDAKRDLRLGADIMDGERRAKTAAIEAESNKRIADLDRQIKEAIAGLAKPGPGKKPHIGQAFGPGPSGLADMTKGTFSSYAVAQSLAVSEKMQDRIATATEKTADNTEAMLDKLDELNGPTFA
jgi:hypothetical protein